MPSFDTPWVYAAQATSAASPSRLWTLLTDLPRYSRWNPFTPRVWGELRPGERVLLFVRVGPLAMFMLEQVERVEQDRELVWSARWPLGLLHGRRVQRLEPTADGGCTYFTEERFKGLLAPLVHFFARGVVTGGFQATARALCAAAESAPSEPSALPEQP